MKMTKLEKRFMRTKAHMRKNVELVDKLLTKINLSDVKTVLEAGCGVGMASAYLAKRGLNVTGVDLDDEQIAMAKTFQGESGNLRFMVDDITTLPFEDGKFDMALSIGVMHHIPTWDKALTEIVRVLKPNGNFLFGDLAYSRFTVKLFGRLTKKYGVYTIDDIIGHLERMRCSVAFRGTKEGRFGFHKIVFRKNPI